MSIYFSVRMNNIIETEQKKMELLRKNPSL